MATDREQELEKHLRNLLDLLHRGFLVRNTKDDHRSDWAIRAMPKMKMLAEAANCIDYGGAEERDADDDE